MIWLIWYDMIYDMIWYDMIWYDMIWYGIWYMIYDIWYDMIWYDMIWYDMIWHDMIYDRKLHACIVEAKHYQLGGHRLGLPIKYSS